MLEECSGHSLESTPFEWKPVKTGTNSPQTGFSITHMEHFLLLDFQ
jgi:hypothetical protein